MTGGRPKCTLFVIMLPRPLKPVLAMLLAFLAAPSLLAAGPGPDGAGVSAAAGEQDGAKNQPAPPPPELLQALAQDYEPRPALWRMADADTTLYLLGTIHILPREFRWRSAKIDQIIAEADELIVETTGEDNVDFDSMIAANRGKSSLSAMVIPANRPKLKALAKQLDMPFDQLDAVPLWLTSFVFLYETGHDLGLHDRYGVESVLEREFRKAGKPIGSIEDRQVAVMALAKANDQQMLDELNYSLSAWDGEGPLTAQDYGLGELRGIMTKTAAKDMMRQFYKDYFAENHAWARGEAEAMAKDLTPEDIGPEFYKALVVDRNIAWTQWLIDRMERPGTVLIAVGSAHLAGPDSVQIMLEKRGFKAERVD